jgi:hypothetical protein
MPPLPSTRSRTSLRPGRISKIVPTSRSASRDRPWSSRDEPARADGREDPPPPVPGRLSGRRRTGADFGPPEPVAVAGGSGSSIGFRLMALGRSSSGSITGACRADGGGAPSLSSTMVLKSRNPGGRSSLDEGSISGSGLSAGLKRALGGGRLGLRGSGVGARAGSLAEGGGAGGGGAGGAGALGGGAGGLGGGVESWGFCALIGAPTMAQVRA